MPDTQRTLAMGCRDTGYWMEHILFLSGQSPHEAPSVQWVLHNNVFGGQEPIRGRENPHVEEAMEAPKTHPGWVGGGAICIDTQCRFLLLVGTDSSGFKTSRGSKGYYGGN